MKKVIVILLSGLLFSSVYTQEPELQEAPLNPEFIRYMDSLKKDEVSRLTSDGHPLGYIPHSIQYQFEIPANLQKKLDLPATYDLRTGGLVTIPKDQSDCNCCWAFASIGAIESNWLVLGLSAFDLSEQNLKNGHGYVAAGCAGGNASYSTAYFTRGDGPISEADDPYDINDDTYVAGLTPQGYITDARFLPNLNNVIKQYIYDYGAVFSNMYYESTYYNSTNKTYYYNGANPSTNHAILLVGWDDTKSTGGGTGAWIVKNSWGTTFGESGYFYISYYDTRVNSNPACWPNRTNYNSNAMVYYYDKLGSTGSVGFNNPTGYGLVKFTPSQNRDITKVGTWVNTSNTTVNLTVYDNFNGTLLSSQLGSTGDQTCDYPGYYTFDLPTPISISNGNDFYIRVKYTAPGENLPIPVEQVIDGYSNPVIETGKCWISSNGLGWSSIGNDKIYKIDLCIKAYGVIPGTSVESSDKVQPEEFTLYQNFPNPFNPETTIEYQLPTAEHVVLKIIDSMGREVIKLVDEKQEAGYYKTYFDASELPSGIYICHITAGHYNQTLKLTLLK